MLPDMAHYRKQMIAKGASLPLTKVPAGGKGLMAGLPATSGHTGWPWNTEVDPKIYLPVVTWPKVTIVTPSYNQAAFLEKTIRSVLLQNYPNLEYIIIDGGSTDGSAEIIERYQPWLSYRQIEKDGGQSNAINQGFSIGSGKYFAWLNSDDYYLPETLFRVVSRFLKTQARFVYGYTLNYVVATESFAEPTKVTALLDYFLRFPSIAQPSAFWDSAIHQPVWEDLHCAMDYELWLRIVKGEKRSLIKAPLSVANIHGDAKTSDPKMQERWHSDHLLICSENAHGPVKDWNRRVLLYRIYQKIYKWLRLP